MRKELSDSTAFEKHGVDADVRPTAPDDIAAAAEPRRRPASAVVWAGGTVL